MSTRFVSFERLLVYLWAIVFPWQTVWIYRAAFLNGSVWQYGTLGLYLSEGILWLLCVVGILNFRSTVDIEKIDKKKVGKRLLFLFLFLAFPLYALISVWWSHDTNISLRSALYIIEGYLLLATIIVSRVRLQDWLRAILFGSIAPLILGLFQWFSQSTFSSTLLGLSEHAVSDPGTSIIASETIGRWLRVYGSFPHPNIFGGYLVFVLACTFLFKLYSEKLSDRIFGVVIHGVGLFVLFTTFSRSAFLGYFFVCMGFFVYALKKYFRRLLPLFVATILLGLFFGIIYHDIVFTRTVPISISETRSLTERNTLLHIAWKLHLEKPIVGFGGGAFTYAWYISDNTLPGYVYQPVHVVWYVVLVEYGYIGLLLLVFSLGLCVWYGYGQSSGKRTIWLFAGILPFVCISFFDHYTITLYPGILIFFAYLAVFFKFSTDTPQSVPKV